jgi:hypothetical protein
MQRFNGTRRARRVVGAVGVAATVVAAQLVVATPAQAIPGLVKVVATSAANAANSKTVTAFCPAGRVVVGGGGRVNNGWDAAGGQVHLNGLRPLAGGAGYTARATEEPSTDFAQNWSVTAIAICAFPPPGYQIVTAASPINGNNGKVAVAACPTGRQVVGTGGWLDFTVGDVVLDAVIPSAALGSVAARGMELFNNPRWRINAYAICMAPPPGGLSRPVLSSAFNSLTPKFVSVSCPAGQFVHGAGFNYSGGNGRVFPLHVDDSAPATVRVSGYEWEGGQMGNWLVTGYAICAA